MRRIELKNEEIDEAELAAAVEAVRRGQLVVLPTETVYGLAADPDDPASIARLQAQKGRAAEHRFTHHVASAAHAARLAGRMPTTARRLAARYWPGPLTLIVPGRDEPTIGLRVPAHPFTLAVLAAFPRGLLLTSANRTGAPPLVQPDEIAHHWPDLDLLVDAGPPPLGEASAVVRCVGAEVEVLREGTLRRDELLATAAATVLFVCTGNTCRSPLAAALARLRLAAALGIAPEGLETRGLRIASAGTFAAAGAPASEHALDVAREVGLTLDDHLSRPLAAEASSGIARVYALTRAHLEVLHEIHPELAGRATLLDPDGADVPDPFGGDAEAYRRARDAIDAAIRARLPEMLALVEE